MPQYALLRLLAACGLAAASLCGQAQSIAREDRIAKCVIKPVMTDAEIDNCRTAGR